MRYKFDKKSAEAIEKALKESELMRKYKIQTCEDLKKKNVRILQASDLNLIVSIKVHDRIVLININLDNSNITEKRISIKKQDTLNQTKKGRRTHDNR